MVSPSWIHLTLLSQLVFLTASFELTLDTEPDTLLWRIRGRYFYTGSGEDLESVLVPSESAHLLGPGVLSQPGVKGLWFMKHVPNRDNRLTFSYSLKHQLFTQAWVSFLSHPTVPLRIRTNNGALLGTFWSDGRTWCDAVVSVGLKITVTLEVTTVEPRDFFVLDKVILGIFGNITHLNDRKLNPCSTEPVPIPISNDLRNTTRRKSGESRLSPTLNPENTIKKHKSERDVSAKEELTLPVVTEEALMLPNESSPLMEPKPANRTMPTKGKTGPSTTLPPEPELWLNDEGISSSESSTLHTRTTTLSKPRSEDASCECSCTCQKKT